MEMEQAQMPPVKHTQILADGFGFLEGPRWRNNELWVSDMGTNKVLRITEDGKSEVAATVPGRPSGIGFLPDGTPIVVSMFDRVIYRIESGDLTVHADLTSVSQGMINEMLVDAQGRAYVGNIGYNVMAGDKRQVGSIILVQPDGAVRTVAEEMEFPNGTVISDGRLFVFESIPHRLTSFLIEPDGSLSGRRIEAVVDGMPDGCCLDVEGGIWVALTRQEKFVRVLKGQIVGTVETPGRLAIACQLGGERGKTLFCLTFAGDVVRDLGRIAASSVEVVQVEAAAAGSP